MPFLDERFPVDISYGASLNHVHSVDVTTTADGSEFRSLNHPYVRLNYDVTYEDKLEKSMLKVAALYDRANGKYRSFRVRDLTDYSTKDYRLAPTALDMPLYRPGADVHVYQLVRWYGDPTDPECSRRVIKKPVAGTVRVARDGIELAEGTEFTVDLATGLVTIAGGGTDYKSADIWASQTTSPLPASIVIGVVNANFVLGDIVNLSGLTGMPWANGMSGEVLMVIGEGTPEGIIVVGIDPAGQPEYVGLDTGLAESGSSGGSGYITGGCEFDIPCRFDSDFTGALPAWEQLHVTGLALLEVFNP